MKWTHAISAIAMFAFCLASLFANAAPATSTAPASQPAKLVTDEKVGTITFSPACTQGAGMIGLPLGSFRIKIVGHEDGFCVFDYTREIEGGYSTWRYWVPAGDPEIVINASGPPNRLKLHQLIERGNLLNHQKETFPIKRPTEPTSQP